MSSKKWVLQLCHGYDAPFDDVARQWRVLFKDTDYHVLTVFITGAMNPEVESLVSSDKTLFLGYSSKDLKGLKRQQISDLKELHKQYGFEFAICHRYKPIYIACHLPGIKVYGIAHAYGVFDGFWRKLFAYRYQEKLTLFGVSNAIRDDVRKSLSRMSTNKILTFYNHIDEDKYSRQQVSKEVARKHLGLPGDKYVIGNVGRLHPDKDQATLLRAFAALNASDALLVIVGVGRLERELKALASTLGVAEQVLFLGRIDNAWMYFKAFDVFVLSSDNEPFGMVLLEAIVANVPVLSTDGGGAVEIVEDDCRFAIGDSRALAKLIARVRSEGGNKFNRRLKQCFTDEGAKSHFANLLNR